MALKPESVIDAVVSYYRECPGCAGIGRSTHDIGREVDRRVCAAREAVRRFINARPCTDEYGSITPTKEVVFTKNATEAINLVARGYPFRQNAVVLTSDREHSSNLCPWKDLEKAGRIRHLYVPSTADGAFDMDAYESILERERPELVSVVHVSNLDGYELPAQRIIELAHNYGARVLLDAAQSAPHRPIDVQALDVDFMALSIHKLCGPTGVGVLYGKEELLADPAFRPLMTGGDTVSDTFLDRPPEYLDPPFRFEAGLQDYAGIIGAGAAVDFIQSIGFDWIRRHINSLNAYLDERLADLRDEFDILGPSDPTQRNGITTLCFNRRGVVSLWDEDLTGIGRILNKRFGVMVRTGEFCVHSWFNAHGISREREKLRGSLYLYNTRADCDAFADALARILNMNEYRMLPRV